MSEDLSSSKEKELILFKGKVNEVVHEIKYNRNYDSACALLAQYNLSFEKLIQSTVRLSMNDLATLADKAISQK